MALDMRDGRARTTVNRHAVIVKLELYKEDIAVRFKEFQASVKTTLSTEQIRKFLEANGQDLSGSNDALLQRCQDLLFYGPLGKCPVCNGNNLEFTGYFCECGTCIYRSRYPPRKRGPIKYPISIIKQINPHFNPRFDPPYVEDQGFFGRLWPEFIPQHDPYRPAGNRVEMTLTTYQDEVEINGRRMKKRTFWIYVMVIVLTGFFMVKLWSKLSTE
ncbi:PREDICTED: poly [Prunus dulcis]|uniref:PREDICTED: poly n=1 Tax=Prunus dulcis TaxID=3755 RepID=A0A5E4EWM8_PRUDU|nr:PREDICTED: poly [Prunus dulcis]